MHVRSPSRPLRLDFLRARFGREAARILAALPLFAATPAAAQEPPADTARVHPLEPLLVRVPGSSFAPGAPRPIAALSGLDLVAGRAAVFLEEAVQALPGVQIQNRYNFAVGERLSVRGFGGRAQFGVRGVRVLVDGIPATLPDGQSTLDHLDVGTLGRVEALRGPAASLYGNAAGGVLHFQTRDPSTDAIRPEVFTVFGSDGLRQLRGTASGAAGDVGWLISAARVDYDGFRRDPVADDGSTYGAARRWSGNATLHLPGGPGRLRAAFNWLDLAAENPGSLARPVLEEWDRRAFTNNVAQRTRKDVRQSQAGVSWTGPLGGARAEVAGYGVLRSVENPIPSDIIDLDRTGWGARALAEAPARVAGRRLSIGGGVEIDMQSDDRQNYRNDVGQRAELRLDQKERVTGGGVFGYFRAELAPGADINAGLRYDRFHFRADDRFVTNDPDDSGDRTMDAVSPSVGLLVRAAPGVELFGSVTTSFETPSTTELANRPEGAGGFNPELEAQRGTTLEAGIRTGPGRLGTAELTVHRTNLRDELVPFEVPDVPGRTFYRNAGRSRHRGFEVAVASAPVAGVSARVAWSVLDARFIEFSRGTNVFDDNRIPGLARQQLDVVTRWDGDRLFTELRGQYRGAVPVDDANTTEAAPFFLLDWRIGAPAVRVGGVELAPVGGIGNLLDRRYVAAVTVNAFGGRFFEPGPGRSFHLGLRTALPVRR